MSYLGKKKAKSSRFWSQYILNIGLTIIVFTLGILIGMLLRNEHLINREIKTRAESHIQHILKTRSWNAHYGGVYVKKKEGVESNPYLKNPDIRTADGKTYTLKNPELMTKELSELFEKDGLMNFHLTSLKPMNPDNAPDEFEKQALKLFENGEKEFFLKDKINEKTTYRYMVPLLMEESCIKCHGWQGYKAGDIRGGLSVSFDISEIEKSLGQSRYAILLMGALSALALTGIIYMLSFVLRKKLEGAQNMLNELVVIDDLTGLYNRQYLFTKLKDEIKRTRRFGQYLGCMIIDIDYLKKINDQYGNLAGDMILENVSSAVKSTCREIDTAARYGGEEFVVLLPGTDQQGAVQAAQRIRLAVEGLRNVFDQDVMIHVTVSIGVVSYCSDDLKKFILDDQIVRNAEKALFRAKENGRNSVEGAGM